MAARAALATANLTLADGAGALEQRDGRWLARLADGRMAWFPRTAAGRRQLEGERLILRLIERRCRFRAPRVQRVEAGGWDVRAPVPGLVAPTDLYHRLRADPGLAARLGAALGATIAEQHRRLHAIELGGCVPSRVGWPLPDRWLKPRLTKQTQDAGLLARMDRALAAYRRDLGRPVDPVLVHADLGLHNIALTDDGESLAGIFDYGGAALGDRHQDFRYLIFDHARDGLLEAAIAAYEPAAGVRLDRAAIYLANAACAIGFLAFRDGHDPAEPWCGRTLAEDLAWTDLALTRAGF